MRSSIRLTITGLAVAGVITGASALGRQVSAASAAGDAASGAEVTSVEPPTEENGGSIVEDRSYPDAAAILAAQNVKLISGDGHILIADCTTPPSGDVGLIKVRTTEQIGAGGNGLVCFKVTASAGWLNLEVPAVYEIRGDGQRSGTGHQLTAEVSTDAGEHSTVSVNPSGSTQVGIGIDSGNDPTTLLQLKVTG